MASYAFVVAASTGYEKPVTALINSINKYHDDVDIHVLNWDLKPEDIPMDNVKLVQLPTDDPKQKANICRNYRWKYCSELENLMDYSAACVMDADLFLVRNVEKYLNVSAWSSSLIVTSDCTNLLYEEGFRKRYPGVFTEDFYNTKTHCAVPVFFNPNVHMDVFEDAFNLIKTVPHLNDTYAINFAIARSEFWQDTIVLPAYAWTGIHHCQLKPETRVRKILGQYVSEAGDEVYMIHGRWFDEKWVGGLRVTMEKYYRNHLNMNDEQLKKFMPWVDDSIKISLEAYRELI